MSEREQREIVLESQDTSQSCTEYIGDRFDLTYAAAGVIRHVLWLRMPELSDAEKCYRTVQFCERNLDLIEGFDEATSYMVGERGRLLTILIRELRQRPL